MHLQLRGSTAVVTGGSAGIGGAIVEAFAREGCNVAFCSRTAEKNARMLDRLAAHDVHMRADVVDVAQLDEVRAWLDDVGGFDVLVPCVSAMSSDWEQALAVDMRATVGLVEHAIPVLARGRHPVITYIGSKAATYATPGFEAYGAAKAAGVHYMTSLARRLAGDGIRVNTVSPGDTFVEQGFWDRMRTSSPDTYRTVRDGHPMGRFGTPEEVASVAVFLSSPVASFVHGAHLLVDGGATGHVQG